MDTAANNPRYVTCPCQHCDGGIEFDGSDFAKDEALLIECPHCKMETMLFMPLVEVSKPPIIIPSLTPDQASDLFRSISQTQKPPEHEGVYTIIMSPGVVRYLKPQVFWKTDVEKLISAIKLFSENPEIKTPAIYMEEWSSTDSKFYEERNRMTVF
jgi:hypothetical protein